MAFLLADNNQIKYRSDYPFYNTENTIVDHFSVQKAMEDKRTSGYISKIPFGLESNNQGDHNFFEDALQGIIRSSKQ